MSNLKCITCVANTWKVFISNFKASFFDRFVSAPLVLSVHVNLFIGAAIVTLSANKRCYQIKYCKWIAGLINNICCKCGECRKIKCLVHRFAVASVVMAEQFCLDCWMMKSRNKVALISIFLPGSFRIIICQPFKLCRPPKKHFWALWSLCLLHFPICVTCV